MFLVYTVMVSWVYTYLSTHRVVDIKYVQLLYIQKKKCREQGSIPESCGSHLCVFPHARFIGADLHNKPTESHAGYTQDGELVTPR